ncbi:hypothetical protein [Bradyrhizobium yuanmingense]|uniref:hypothetical protein n=1 Tax=Bradyrhizobium yuanmingense TaxID=108015 RepID=UPI0023B96D8C|nr:hypothetical protein [Bradyrhizobium yuanmingense]MDF0584760.1 hypothetical protein [Bradyrhizobium yuanmingense]
MVDTLNIPEWTHYADKGGLDPLGMQNSSVALYQRLIPGVGNVTLRMRYYGLYPWLVRHYLQTNGSTDPQVWRIFLRRAEALYALIANQAGGELGVAGTQWAIRAVTAAKTGGGLTPIDIAAAATAPRGSDDNYFDQNWGVFGLAYQSQLYEIGVLSRGDGHGIPLPSKESGMALAENFEAAMGGAALLFKDVHARGLVTFPELHALNPFAPSQIAFGSAERDAYQRLLFRKLDDEGTPDSFRTLTLLLVLKVAEKLGRPPNAEELRWALYAGQTQGGDALELGETALIEHCERWRVYQANDLCHVALEALLRYVLDVLGAEPAGLSPRQLLERLIAGMRESSGATPQSWRSLLVAIELSDNAGDRARPDSEWSLADDIMRAARRANGLVNGEIGFKAVRLLAVLHKRSLKEAWPLEGELGPFTNDSFHSLLSERAFLQRYESHDFWELIARLVEERVIRRHLAVAMRKLRQQKDYTFVIESQNGRLRRRKQDGPVYTNPRLQPAITFLKDIHVLGGQGLTSHGVEALAAA